MLRGRYSPFNLIAFNQRLDHGLLIGLGDNDHPQYLLVVDYKVVDGTAQGQVLFWDEALQTWTPTEISELVFDDNSTPKRIGINKAVPTSELDVGGTVTMTRLLAGGVTE